MSEFEIVQTEERFNEIMNDRKFDDQSLISFLNNLNQEGDHTNINFVLQNVGGLLKLIGIYFRLKEEELQRVFEIKDEKERNRKFVTIIRELNEKINLRYNFKDLKIVQKLYIYEGTTYLLVNKMLFVNKIINKKDEYVNTEYY